MAVDMYSESILPLSQPHTQPIHPTTKIGCDEKAIQTHAIHAYRHTDIHPYIFMNTYMHIHKHTHTYIHT